MCSPNNVVSTHAVNYLDLRTVKINLRKMSEKEMERNSSEKEISQPVKHVGYDFDAFD